MRRTGYAAVDALVARLADPAGDPVLRRASPAEMRARLGGPPPEQGAGLDAVLAQYGRYGGETHGPFQAQLHTVYEAEDGKVVGYHRNVGQRNGKQLDTECCIVFEVEDGRLKSGTEHFFDLHNWDDFWS